MLINLSIIVAYYGEESFWRPYVDRALESAFAQTVPAQVIQSYGTSLQDARNQGARKAVGDYLVFLDADDTLDPGYVAAMLAGEGDVRQPSTLGITDGVPDDQPVLLPVKNLLDGNYLVIGSMVRRQLFEKVGGFSDLPAWEDWDLWLRCWLAGAVITACPEAIYRVHVRSESRNRLDQHGAGQLYAEIRGRYLEPARKAGLA